MFKVNVKIQKSNKQYESGAIKYAIKVSPCNTNKKSLDKFHAFMDSLLPAWQQLGNSWGLIFPFKTPASVPTDIADWTNALLKDQCKISKLVLERYENDQWVQATSL